MRIPNDVKLGRVNDDEPRRAAVDRAHAADVFRVACGIIRNPEAPADTAHDAFARAYERWGVRSLGRYLMTLALVAGLAGCGSVVPSATAPAATASPTLGSPMPSAVASTPVSQAPGTVLPALPAGIACGSAVALGPTAATPAPGGPISQPTWSKAGVVGAASSVAWSPDGTLLASTPGDPHGTDDTATLWSAGGRRVAILRGHTAPVQCAAWSPDSQLLATASEDGSVRMWDRTGRFVRSLPGTHPVFSLAWSPDGSVLAVGAIAMTGQLPGVITLWRRDGAKMRTLGTTSTGGKFLSLAWSRDGMLLGAGAGDYIAWRADGSQSAILRQGGTPAWAFAWSPDGRTFALGNESGMLTIVSAAGAPLGLAQFPTDVNAVSYVPDGSGVIVGLIGKVQLVHPLDPQNPAHAIWSAATADDGHVAWSPDGTRLAIAVTDGLAILSADGSALAALTGCPGDPVAFAWTGTRLAAATSQGRLCAWQAP